MIGIVQTLEFIPMDSHIHFLCFFRDALKGLTGGRIIEPAGCLDDLISCVICILFGTFKSFTVQYVLVQ